VVVEGKRLTGIGDEVICAAFVAAMWVGIGLGGQM